MSSPPIPSALGWRRAIVATLVVAASVSLSMGCLRRPVTKEEPTTKISFETSVPQPAIDKIDLLVMIDNSASMADKQRILARAVPDLVQGLVQPKCVDKVSRVPTGTLSDPTKPEDQMCPAGAQPVFPPITDMHLGVISSSLGGLGSSSCTKEHQDDHAHLLARAPQGRSVGAAGDMHFLAWYPNVETNRDKIRHPEPPVAKLETVDALSNEFRSLIEGVGQDGCGLEAQLESVYRFLVQPDPWVTIETDRGAASYGPKGAIDDTLLAERAAFLRPDSLVAVIMLTDEDDSSSDPLSFRGTGWLFMEDKPREKATAVCASDPASPDCTSCLFKPEDSACSGGGKYGAKEDNRNVRFHRMKERFGVEPQFPVSRYVEALSKFRVPARDLEHDASGRYSPKAGCTNPLFAARLPQSSSEELCKLPRGPRTPSLVYFALIGGVPNELLPSGDEPSAKIDWTKILGRDPSRYDETGIDPHMIQSTRPRAGLPSPTAADDADPIHGREWDTGGADLEFACTFPLYEVDADGHGAPVRRECPAPERDSCDCNGTKDTPLCAPDNRTVQLRGKAYPTRRELMVVKDLDVQGIVASLCPKQLSTPTADDYGYRPAVRAITDRLERSLVGSCLPRQLDREGDLGKVACSVLAMLPNPGDDASECARFGLAPPKDLLSNQLRSRLAEEEGEAVTKLPICEIPQITVPKGETCRDASGDIAFCYVEAPTITKCAHALAFTKASEKMAGVRFTMQCIQQSSDSTLP